MLESRLAYNFGIRARTVPEKEVCLWTGIYLTSRIMSKDDRKRGETNASANGTAEITRTLRKFAVSAVKGTL